jgi:hypothetical protein
MTPAESPKLRPRRTSEKQAARSNRKKSAQRKHGWTTFNTKSGKIPLVPPRGI